MRSEASRILTCAERSRRIVEVFHAVATELMGRRATLPKSLLGTGAVLSRHLDGQRAESAILLGDSRIPIHSSTTTRPRDQG
jgi:hypothetical protein